VKHGEGFADGGAVLEADASGPDAGEEGGDAGGAGGELAQAVAVSALDGEGAGDSFPGEVLHEAEEPGELGRVDALFVEGEDVVAGGGAELVVAVFDALGDAAEGDGGA